MQKWEYAVLDVEVEEKRPFWQRDSAVLVYFKFPKPTGIAIKPDKSQGDRNLKDAIGRVVGQLGLEGWEMVGSQGEYLLYFKRPLP